MSNGVAGRRWMALVVRCVRRKDVTWRGEDTKESYGETFTQLGCGKVTEGKGGKYGLATLNEHDVPHHVDHKDQSAPRQWRARVLSAQ